MREKPSARKRLGTHGKTARASRPRRLHALRRSGPADLPGYRFPTISAVQAVLLWHGIGHGPGHCPQPSPGQSEASGVPLEEVSLMPCAANSMVPAKVMIQKVRFMASSDGQVFLFGRTRPGPA
jgi:hypothetical protein